MPAAAAADAAPDPGAHEDRTARRPLDAVALAAQRRRLEGAAEPPWLHQEVARRMAERLPVIRRQPAVVAQWWARLGASATVLGQAYPKARVLRVEPDGLRHAARAAEATAPRPAWWKPARWAGAAAAEVVDEAAVGDAGVQLLWANMGLHFAPDPRVVLRRWQRALEVDGFLMFSTLGPGTLAQLRAIYAEAGWGPPLAPFVDMHDLGDMLVEAGFADPVMDQEQLTLTWPDARAALAELRQLGGNADPARHAGLRTPRWRAQLERRLEASADAGGRIALGFEIVYGHAFRAPARVGVAGQARLPLDELRATLRASRRKPG